MNKHSSLFKKFINYGRKWFHIIDYKSTFLEWCALMLPQPFLQAIDLAEKAKLGRNTPAYLSRESSINESSFMKINPIL
jgi:hypothetical protein